MAAHGLVQIHGVQARRVEARKPHVAHKHDLHGVLRVLEALGEPLTARFVANVILPGQRVGCRAGHDDFDDSLVIVLVVPLRAQFANGFIKLDTNSAAHANNHRLAIHDLEAGFPMLDEIFSDQRDTLLGADERLQRGPLCLEAFFSLHLFALGDFLKTGIDLGAFFRF